MNTVIVYQKNQAQELMQKSRSTSITHPHLEPIKKTTNTGVGMPPGLLSIGVMGPPKNPRRLTGLFSMVPTP